MWWGGGNLRRAGYTILLGAELHPEKPLFLLLVAFGEDTVSFSTVPSYDCEV